MSKKHQAHRRRAYGRRQHELYERRTRWQTWDGFAIHVVDIDDPELLDTFGSLRPDRTRAFDLRPSGPRWVSEAG